MNLFKESEKSTFSYWFAHWCAYQMTALNLKVWKPKYLLHDIEKPWLMLFFKDYSKVKEFHRKHARHHIAYKGNRKHDWEAMVIDWECSRFTKEAAQLNARQTLQYEIEKYPQFKTKLLINIVPILNKLNL